MLPHDAKQLVGVYLDNSHNLVCEDDDDHCMSGASKPSWRPTEAVLTPSLLPVTTVSSSITTMLSILFGCLSRCQ